jgi:hypothetical protein
MIRPISERDYVGLTLIEADVQASTDGYEIRVVEEDGVSKMLDMDVKSNRLNLRLRNNIVTAAYTG